MQNITKLDIYADGGSRGNPGPAAIGVHAVRPSAEIDPVFGLQRPVPQKGSDLNGDVIFQLSQPIGHTTNNVAEWQAVIKAVEHLHNHNITADQINFFLDSELVIKQITGQYKIKQPHLQLLSQKLNQLLPYLSSARIIFHHIPREQNKIADSLVNQALNNTS